MQNVNLCEKSKSSGMLSMTPSGDDRRKMRRSFSPCLCFSWLPACLCRPLYEALGLIKNRRAFQNDPLHAAKFVRLEDGNGYSHFTDVRFGDLATLRLTWDQSPCYLLPSSLFFLSQGPIFETVASRIPTRSQTPDSGLCE